MFVCYLIIYLSQSNLLSFSALSIPGFIKIDSRQRPWSWGGRMENERDVFSLWENKTRKFLLHRNTDYIFFGTFKG